MPVGIIINALSVAIGGVVGALFGHKLPTRINSELTKIFGVCSMGMGVSSIGLMKNMPAVIFAVIIGTAFGLAVNLGGIINSGAACMEKPVGKIFPNKNASMSREEYMTMLVTIIVLFCASGTGIYGSLDSGMSGDHTILISKSILDFFTAMIFGGTLGLRYLSTTQTPKGDRCNPAVRDLSRDLRCGEVHLSAYHTGYDRGLQGLRWFSSSGHRFPHRKDPQLPGSRYDPRHGARHAGELVLGECGGADAVRVQADEKST